MGGDMSTAGDSATGAGFGMIMFEVPMNVSGGEMPGRAGDSPT